MPTSTLNPRQADILALARRFGRLDVEDLAARFDVTPQTFRRDLNQLGEQGLLQRICQEHAVIVDIAPDDAGATGATGAQRS